MLLIYSMNLHSLLYRKPQNFGGCLFILLNGTCRAFTGILLSTVLLAATAGKLKVTDIEVKRKGRIHGGTLLWLLSTPETQSSWKGAKAASWRRTLCSFCCLASGAQAAPRSLINLKQITPSMPHVSILGQDYLPPYRDIRFCSSQLLQWGHHILIMSRILLALSN